MVKVKRSHWKGLEAASRLQHEMLADVRSGSISEVGARNREVCFAPRSGHSQLGHARPLCAPPEADIRKGTALYTKGANFCLVEAEEMTLSRPVRREYLSPVVAPANKGIS